jgi:anti-anti-sigma factor
VELKIEHIERPGGLLVRMNGEAGVTVGMLVERELTRVCAARPGLLVLDLEGLVFISSLVMGQLIATHHALIRAGGKMKVAAVPKSVMESFQRARLQTLLEFSPTVDEAFAAK